MNRSILTAIALAVAASSWPADARATTTTRYAERSDQVVDAAGLTTLDLQNTRGLIQVRPSPDGKLHVTAVKLCRFQGHQDAQRYARETVVEARAEQGRWVMRVRYPKRIEAKINFWDLFTEHGRNGLSFPMVEVQLLIQAPARMAATVETVSGDIDFQGITGALTLRTTSGDLTVRDSGPALEASSVSGDLDLMHVNRTVARTTSGDVTAHDTGALFVTTTSGAIEVAAPRDSVRLNSTSGDIEVTGPVHGITVGTSSGEISVQQASGIVRLSSQSGDVQAGLVAPLKRCDLSNTSGDLGIRIGPGIDAALELRTTSGTMDCTLPVRLKRQERTHLSAILGRGGAIVALQTVSGDINLTSGGN